jgi:hypothetical protein
LGDHFKNVLRREGYIVLNNEKKKGIFEYTKLGNKEKGKVQLRTGYFTGYKNYYLPKFSQRDDAEKILFEFSNRLGAFITRLLVEALDEGNYTETLIDLNKEDHQVLIQTYVERSILSIIPHLVSAFKKSIVRIPGFSDEFYENKESDGYTWACLQCGSYTESSDRKILEEYSTDHYLMTGHIRVRLSETSVSASTKVMKKDRVNVFLLNKEIIDYLSSALNNIYPLLNYELTKIIGNMPYSLESHKRLTDDLHKKWERQRNCDHDFEEPVELLNGFGKICSKCGFLEKIKNKKF